MSLGGTVIVDDRGRMIYMDRAFFKPPPFYLGKTCWQYSKNAEEARKMQQAFANALTFGEPVNLTACSGQGIPTKDFRLHLQRIGGSHEIAIRYAPNEPDVLSDAERNIVVLIAHDHRPRDICAQLSISLSTFETHRTSILKKLQVNGTAGITLWNAEQDRWR